MYKIGLALRLAFSLFASYGDVGTDAFLTVEMFRSGRLGFAYGSLIAMGANQLLQIVVIFLCVNP